LNVLLSSLLTTWGTSSLFVQVIVVPAGIVTVAGPKLKLSIFISAALAGLSLVLPAKLGLAAARKASAVPRIAAIAQINLILFILFLLLKFFRN
jgi:hypothetical protein